MDPDFLEVQFLLCHFLGYTDRSRTIFELFFGVIFVVLYYIPAGSASPFYLVDRIAHRIGNLIIKMMTMSSLLRFARPMVWIQGCVSEH